MFGEQVASLLSPVQHEALARVRTFIEQRERVEQMALAKQEEENVRTAPIPSPR